MNIDNKALEKLSEKERKIALSILNEIKDKGESTILNKIKYQDFDERPVDIHTFLHDKRYLGNALYDADDRFTLFPYWEKVLEDIFPDNIHTKYNTLILTGAIGLGKSTIAVICLLYMLYRLLCLKDPYLYYGMQPIDKITISLMNITLENAKGVALDKMNQMIMSSEWFMSHGEMTGETNLVYRPNKHIELITASSNNQIIGRCLDGDTEIVTTEGVFKLKDLVNTLVKVISIDENENKVVSEECTIKETIKTNEQYEIELENGAIIKCTANHRFMLKDGTYKEAKDLTEDDELYDCVPFGYIYKFTNKSTNKIYIGKREKSFFDESYYGSGKLWKEDLLKFGKENITREILCWGYSREELNKLERMYIKKYNSQDSSVGYNIHKGGQGGNSLNDTEAWSNLHKGEKNGRFHKEVSQETRDKISKANKGKNLGVKCPGKGGPGVKKPSGFGEKISKYQKNRIRTEKEKDRFKRLQKEVAKKLIGSVIYNNGTHELRLHDEDTVPQGYIKGRLKLESTYHNLPRNFHWYNNGIKTIYCEKCPEGFKPGRKLS